MKKLLEPLSAAALLALALSVALIIAPALTCVTIVPEPAHVCPQIVSTSVLLGVLLLTASFALAVFTWFVGLSLAAKERQWAWFGLILILNIFGVLAYALTTKRSTTTD